MENGFSPADDVLKEKLSSSEKLELNEMIWRDDISISFEHQAIVNERIKKSKANPEFLLEWEVAAKELRA